MPHCKSHQACHVVIILIKPSRKKIHVQIPKSTLKSIILYIIHPLTCPKKPLMELFDEFNFFSRLLVQTVIILFKMWLKICPQYISDRAMPRPYISH